MINFVTSCGLGGDSYIYGLLKVTALFVFLEVTQFSLVVHISLKVYPLYLVVLDLCLKVFSLYLLVLDLCLKVHFAGLLPNCKVVSEGAKSHLSKLLWSENKVAIPHKRVSSTTSQLKKYLNIFTQHIDTTIPPNGVSSTTSQPTTELNIFRQHINTTERMAIPPNGVSSTTAQLTNIAKHIYTTHKHNNPT